MDNRADRVDHRKASDELLRRIPLSSVTRKESEKKVLAFLQNGWYNNPRRAQQLYNHATLDERARMCRYGLFAGCTTGKRLLSSFGEELCDLITWRTRVHSAALRHLTTSKLIRRTLREYWLTTGLTSLSISADAEERLKELVVERLQGEPRSWKGDGASPFGPDLQIRWLLQVKIIDAPHPVSRMRGSSIDTERAMLELKRALGL